MHFRALQRAILFACAFVLIVTMLGLAPVHAQEAAGPYFAADHARLAKAPASGHRYALTRHSAPHPLGGISAMVTRSALSHGVPPRIALAVVKIESGGRCGAHNRNARGAMQVLKRTAASVGVYGNLLDCSTGIEAGMRYLAMIVHAHGTSCGSISLYNTGAYGRPRCTAYGRRVLSLA